MGSKTADPGTVQTVTPREWLRVVMVHVSIPLILLACGGDIRWWQAWVFSLLIVAGAIMLRKVDVEDGIAVAKAEDAKNRDLKVAQQ